jgi:hypothetical protein
VRPQVRRRGAVTRVAITAASLLLAACLPCNEPPQESREYRLDDATFAALARTLVDPSSECRALCDSLSGRSDAGPRDGAVPDVGPPPRAAASQHCHLANDGTHVLVCGFGQPCGL